MVENPQSECKTSELNRRSFLSRLSIILSSIGAAMVAIPSVGFLLGLRRPTKVWRTVGPLQEFPNRRYIAGLFPGSIAASMVRSDSGDVGLASASESGRIHCLLGRLYPSGMPNSLASKRQSVHVPMSRRCLLCRWKSGFRAASATALPLPGTCPGWPGSNPDEPAANCVRELKGESHGMWKRLWAWFDDLTGTSSWLNPLLQHPVPHAKKSAWFYVLGSATLVVFILQIVTGISLSSSYIASSGDAYQSLLFISGTTLGRIVRGIHYFGASAMIILIGLHAVRVYLMGSYKYPRQVNWLTGVGLLFLTLLMAFTGQLLRWDQTGFWTAVVAAEQAGRTPVIGNWLGHFILAGDTVGGATLSRFFSAHVFFIPALIFLFLGFHLYLVIHNGISEPPRAGHPVDPRTYRRWYADLLAREGQPFWPDAAWRDVVFGFLVVVTIVALAVIIGPEPLGKPPDPTIIGASPRPDWFLLWYYALLSVAPRWSENPPHSTWSAHLRSAF